MSGYYRSILNVLAPAFDADAQAFITAASITDPAQQSAVNQLVVDLKSASIWTKMKAVYPFIGGSPSSHKWNLKDPRDLDAAYRLAFAGGWTHSSTGAKPNGTTGYANTYITPGFHQSTYDNGMGCYITENTVSGTVVQMGTYDADTRLSYLWVKPTQFIGVLNSGVVATAETISGGFGSFDVHRTSETVTSTYKNGSFIKSANLGGTLAYSSIYLGCLNIASTPSLYSDSEFRFAYLSSGLNSTDISNLRTAVNTFQTTLSRNI